MQIRPQHDYVLISIDKAPPTTAGGLHVPDTARPPELPTGVIVAAGPTALGDPDSSRPDVALNARVVFKVSTTHSIYVEFDHPDPNLGRCALVSVFDVVAVVVA